MTTTRERLTRAAAALPAVMVCGTAACAVLRLTVRDRWPVFSMVFYASPPVAMTFVLLAAAGIWAFRRAWRPSLGAACGALVAAAWWLSTSIVLSPPPDGERPKTLLRGMGWNLERGGHGWDAVREEIRRRDPDVGWFVEAEDPHGSGGPPWHAELEGYDRREMPDGLLFITKGTILEARTHFAGRNSLAEFRLRLRGQALTVLLLDVDGSVWRHRREVLDQARQAVEAAPPGPVILGGDFNTPRDSALMADWRGPLTHAFEAAGRGLDATWPEPFPFLPIDHCWVNPEVKIWSCEHGRTGASDHRPVIVEFQLNE